LFAVLVRVKIREAETHGGGTTSIRERAMRDFTGFPQRLLASLVALFLSSADVRADDIPIRAFQDWNYYNTRGWIYLSRGDYARAEQRFRQAIMEIKPYQTSDQRLLARSYADLARVLYHQGRYADAEPLATWALSVRENNPKVPPDAVFQSLYTLALIHMAEAHFPESERLLRRALDIQEKALGPTHIHTAATLDELAGVCLEQRKFKEAEPLYRRAIAIYERRNSDINLDLATCAEHYAKLLKQMDRTQEAEKWQDRARSIRDGVEANAARAKDDQPRPEFQGFKPRGG
jgi:tetratricopeptide (TPR) repeat protein